VDGEDDTIKRESLLAFPTEFPIKIMGRREGDFAQGVMEIVMRHSPGFDPKTMEMRPSSKGKYLGITVTIQAQSREQLDALYRELSAHPAVVMVL
jgi:putative lipoic acid-binding regulatory protein